MEEKENELIVLSLKDLWHLIWPSLLTLCVLLGLATGLYFLGVERNATVFRFSLIVFMGCAIGFGIYFCIASFLL